MKPRHISPALLGIAVAMTCVNLRPAVAQVFADETDRTGASQTARTDAGYNGRYFVGDMDAKLQGARRIGGCFRIGGTPGASSTSSEYGAAGTAAASGSNKGGSTGATEGNGGQISYSQSAGAQSVYNSPAAAMAAGCGMLSRLRSAEQATAMGGSMSGASSFGVSGILSAFQRAEQNALQGNGRGFIINPNGMGDFRMYSSNR